MNKLYNRKRIYDNSIEYEFEKIFDIEKEEKLIKRAIKLNKILEENREKHQLSKKQKEEKLVLLTEQTKTISEKLEKNISVLQKLLIEEASKTSAIKAWKKYSSEIEEFKKDNDKYFTLINQIKSKRIKNNYYDVLFLNLCNQNKGFFYLAPFSAFTHGYASTLTELGEESKFNFGQFEKSEMLELQQYFIAKNRALNNNIKGYESIFLNEYFKTNYLKFFPYFIKHLTNSRDICKALTIDPSKYPHVATDNMRNLTYYISQSPEIFLYLNDEELENFASKCNSNFGISILEFPSMLDKLDPYFFLDKKHTFKFVFSRVTAKDLKKIENKMGKFVGWHSYFNAKKKYSTHTVKESKRKTKEEKLAEIKAQLEDTTPID